MSPGDLGFDRLDQLDVLRDLGDRPFARQQRVARFRRARRSADDADDLVEVGDRDDQPEQQVRAVARLGEFELRAARDDLLAELDERLDDVAQVEQLGPPAADRQHVGRE